MPGKHSGGNGNTMKKGGDWQGTGKKTGDGKKSDDPQTTPVKKKG
jgi:hypothetical protein